jgi:predicted nucleotidyltransferase
MFVRAWEVVFERRGGFQHGICVVVIVILFGWIAYRGCFCIKLMSINGLRNYRERKLIGVLGLQRSLDEVKGQLEALKPTLRKRFKVETIDIFGSYARGEQTEKSDLDILVTYSEMVDLLLVAELRRYLRRKLRMKVDVISKKYLNKYIKDQVLEEAIPV